MGTDTQGRPGQVTRTERPTAAPARGRVTRTAMLVLALLALLGVALVVAALVSEPTTTRAEPSAPVAGLEQQEVQRSGGAADADRSTTAGQPAAAYDNAAPDHLAGAYDNAAPDHLAGAYDNAAPDHLAGAYDNAAPDHLTETR